MKILYVTSLFKPYYGGGAEKSTEILVDNMSKYYKVFVITTGYESKKCTEKEEYNVYRMYIKDKTEKLLAKFEDKEIKISLLKKLKLRISDYFINRYVRIIDKFFKENNIKNIDIIHTTNNMINFFPFSFWKYGKLNNIKVIHTLRDPNMICLKGYMLCEYGEKCNLKAVCQVYRKLNLNLMNLYVDFIHSPSNYMLRLYEKYGLSVKNKVVIPNSVDIEISSTNNFSEKDNIILYLGNFGKHKGIFTLLKAFVNIDNKNFKLYFIGDGPEKRKLEKLISKYTNIKIINWLNKEELFRYIKKSKIVVLPSEWPEAFGRTLIEAVYNGTLIIGSNAGAIPEVIQDNRFIFNVKNHLELASKIEWIMSMKKHEYNNEVENLRYKMRRFSLKEHVRQFRKFYENIQLNKKRKVV